MLVEGFEASVNKLNLKCPTHHAALNPDKLQLVNHEGDSDRKTGA